MTTRCSSGFPSITPSSSVTRSWATTRVAFGCTAQELRENLRALLDLEVELVLVSHGEPVRGDAELQVLFV